jgi:hypothetical protein
MQTKEERLALIKAAAEKIKDRNKFKARLSASSARVRGYTDAVEKPARKRKLDAFDKKIEALDENYNTWTDAPTYAKEYYGEVAYETTRYDNEWN